jgi:hypothetical protein
VRFPITENKLLNYSDKTNSLVIRKHPSQEGVVSSTKIINEKIVNETCWKHPKLPFGF